MITSAERPAAGEGKRKRLTTRGRDVLVRSAELCPLTLRGAGLFASAALSLWLFGYRALDQVWYVTGVALLALVAIALLIVLAATLRVFLALRAQPAESPHHAIDTEMPRATGYTLPSLWLWPFVDVYLTVHAPSHVRVDTKALRSQLHESLTSTDHGELRAIVRKIEIRDVFGLASLTLRQQGRVQLDVLPHAGALRSLPLLRSLAGGDDMPHPMGLTQGDRLELRRYAPGDPARFIHWKVFARTQKLVVRVPERALARAHRVAAFLVSGQFDGASAAAARVALEERAFGDDFRFGADGSPAPAERVADALVAVRQSAHARDRGGQGLLPFLAAVEREGPVSLILFVPPKLGAEQEPMRSALSRRSRPARVVIGVDGIANDQDRALWGRITFLPRSEDGPALSALRETLKFYRKLGADVVVLDRRSGRVLGDAHFAAREPAKKERAA